MVKTTSIINMFLPISLEDVSRIIQHKLARITIFSKYGHKNIGIGSSSPGVASVEDNLVRVTWDRIESKSGVILLQLPECIATFFLILKSPCLKCKTLDLIYGVYQGQISLRTSDSNDLLNRTLSASRLLKQDFLSDRLSNLYLPIPQNAF